MERTPAATNAHTHTHTFIWNEVGTLRSLFTRLCVQCVDRSVDGFHLHFIPFYSRV